MRTLSSAQTWWIKYFIPAAFALSMVGMGLWWTFIEPLLPGDSSAWSLLLLFCIVIVLGTFLIAWQGLALKRVRMDDDALFVSNGFREFRIPLSEMERVSEYLDTAKYHRYGPQGNRVTITVRSDTPFGRKIVFLPASSRPGKADPVVRELKALIRQ
jgi:hypothetical protein